jgi:hypothetical protein
VPALIGLPSPNRVATHGDPCLLPLRLIERACAERSTCTEPVACASRSPAHSPRSQARGVKNPTVIAPGGSGAWIDARSGNMSSFCNPLLKDVSFALTMQRRRRRLEKKGQSVRHLPEVMLVKYDELLSRPLEIVKEAHAALGVYTSQPKLTTFVHNHLDPNYTVARDIPVASPVVSMANVTGGKVVVHKLRKRLKTEFGTVRPVSATSKRESWAFRLPSVSLPSTVTQPSAHTRSVRLPPLPFRAYHYPLRLHLCSILHLRSPPPLSLSSLAGHQSCWRRHGVCLCGFSLAQPRQCNELRSMDEWPECAELLRLLHPIYLC